MPITRSKMAVNEATATFQYQGDSVSVTYVPGKINDAMIDKLDGNSEALTQALAEIITSWDVMDDSVDPPVMFPINLENLKELGYPFRLHVRQAIIQDMRPNSIATQN